MPLAALFLLAAAVAPTPTVPPSPFTAVSLYDGAWTVSPTIPATVAPLGTAAGAPQPDHLVNHCHEDTAFYSCEQIVNGKSVALVVFTAADTPGHFHTQAVRPNGYANGRADLTLDGAHWTFNSSSTDAGKTTWYRTENFFTGKDRIHFEQFESTDNKTWTKKGQGDEVRATPQ